MTALRRPRPLPWIDLGSPGAPVVAWDVSPSEERLALVQGGTLTSSSTLRILELATGRVVREEPAHHHVVFWLDDRRLIGVRVRHAVQLDVVDTETGARRELWSPPLRGPISAEQVVWSADRSLSACAVFTAGAMRRFAGMWVIDTAPLLRHASEPSRLEVREITLPARGGAMGTRVQRKTTLHLEPRSGACMVVDEPDYTRPPKVSFVMPRRGEPELHDALGMPPLGHRFSPARWLAPDLVLVRHGFYEGSTPAGMTALYVPSARARTRELSAPSFGYGPWSDAYQALASLERAVVSSDGRRAYGCASAGSGETRWGWVTHLDDPSLPAHRGAPWPWLPHSLAWLGSGVLATRPVGPLVHRASPDDGAFTELAAPGMPGAHREVRTTPRGRWIFVSSYRDVLAYAPASALA